MTDYEKVQKLATDVAFKLGITLINPFDHEMIDPESYDKDDDTKGICWDVVDEKNKLESNMIYALILHISVDENFQFYHDSSPIPTKLHDADAHHWMSQALTDYPMPIKDLTVEIYQEMINTYVEEWLTTEANETIPE